MTCHACQWDLDVEGAAIKRRQTPSCAHSQRKADQR
jgi:hypothetical protein